MRRTLLTGGTLETVPRLTAAQVGALAATAALGGDLTGNAPNPTIAAGAVNLAKLAAGTNGLASQSFSVYRSAAGTAITTAGKVPFDAREFDVSSLFDIATNHRFTPTVPGYYRFAATVGITNALTSSQFVVLQLYKNGAEIKTGPTLPGPVAAGSVAASIEAIAAANGTTDYFEIFITSNALATVTPRNGANLTWFSGSLIGKS